MMDHVGRIAPIDSHIQRIKNQLGRQMRCHRPTDDAPTIDIEHDRYKKKAAPCWNVRDIGNPKLLGLRCSELTIDQVRRYSCIVIADGFFNTLAPRSPVDTAFFYQTSNAFIADVNAFVDEIGWNARASVRLARFASIRFNPITQ